MDKIERIKLIAQMAATMYSGILADPQCGFSDGWKEQCVKEATEMLLAIELQNIQ